jgi:hypothetical protein
MTASSLATTPCNPCASPGEKIEIGAAGCITAGPLRIEECRSNGVSWPAAAAVGNFPPQPRPRWRLIAISYAQPTAMTMQRLQWVESSPDHIPAAVVGAGHARESVWPRVDLRHGTARPDRACKELLHAAHNGYIAIKKGARPYGHAPCFVLLVLFSARPVPASPAAAAVRPAP